MVRFLPQVGSRAPGNALIDFSPIERGVDGFIRQGNLETARGDRLNALAQQQSNLDRSFTQNQANADRNFGFRQSQAGQTAKYRQQQLGAQSERLGFDRARASREDERYNTERANAVVSKFGSTAEYVNTIQDPQQRAIMWQEIIKRHPDAATLPAQFRDPVTGPQLFMAEAGKVLKPQRPVSVSPGSTLVNPQTGAQIYQAPAKPVGNEFEKAKQRELGKVSAKGIADAPQLFEQSSAMATAVRTLIADPALAGNLGSFDARTPNISGQSIRVQKLIDQVKSQAFLAGFARLKGGGAITDAEGRKAEQAIAALDQRMSAEDFKNVLQQLDQIAQRGMEKARQMARGEIPQLGGQQSQPGGQIETKTLNGKTYVKSNGQWFEQ